jgi:putative hydroxymethylpyrimidine transport system permease protein
MFSTRPPGDPPPRAIDIWLSLLMIVLLWQCVVWISQVPSFILPGPVKVAQAIINNAALLAEHTLITAQEVILGLLLGTILGTLTALLLMSSSAARRYLMPALLLSQTVPVFALAPLLTLWFGYGLFSKIVMTILIIYFPVTSTFYDGLANTPRGYLNLARTMRATPRAILIKVRVPAALPSLASGIRLAAVYAPIGAVIGEWVGSSQGLGYLMLLANGRVKTDLMFAALIVLCLFTIVLRALVNRACRGIEARADGRE